MSKLELNIKEIGATVERGDLVTLGILGGVTITLPKGNLPADCVVLFMDKESWKKLKAEMPVA